MNDSIGLNSLAEIDRISDQFEASWDHGEPMEISGLLEQVRPEHQSMLLVELVAIDVRYRQARGEARTIERYIQDFPDFSAELQGLQVTNQGLHSTQHKNVGSETSSASTIDRANQRLDPVGDYELVREIARGGMGVVYEARQTSLNRPVALKMILSGQLAGPEEVRRFRTEAEAAAHLDHPGIVPVYEVGEFEGKHFFSMGFVSGKSLQEKLHDGPLDPREACRIMVRIADAVHYAHQNGVIHRDLKPANVLLDEKESPRITDFGLAKRTADTRGMTATGQILGTPSFMPPEQASGDLDAVDQRSDVYALGALLYALLSGRPPFQAKSPVDTLRLVLDEEPVSVRALNPTIPRDLDTIAKRAMDKHPGRRYQSANDFADDIRRFLGGEPILARPVGRLVRIAKWCKRYPAVAALLVLATFLSMATASFGILESLRREQAFIAREISGEVNLVLKEILEASRPEEALGRDVTVREILNAAAARIDAEKFELRKEVEAELRTTIGNSYQELGELRTARTQLELALELEKQINDPVRTARAREELAGCLYALGEYQAATHQALQAIPVYVNHGINAANLQRTVADCKVAMSDWEAAEYYTQTAEATIGDLPLGGMTRLIQETRLLHSQATLEQHQGKFKDAIGKFEKCLELRLAEFAPNHPLVASVQTDLAATLYKSQGNLDRAKQLLTEALKIREEVLPEQHPLFGYCFHNLGCVTLALGDVEAADDWFSQAVELRSVALDPDALDRLVSMMWWADVKFRRAQREQDETVRRQWVGEGVDLLEATLKQANRFDRTMQENLRVTQGMLKQTQLLVSKGDDAALSRRIEVLAERIRSILENG